MTTVAGTKGEMLTRGILLARRFCEMNGVEMPTIRTVACSDWPFGVCAYYRPESGIHIAVGRCAAVGRGGPAWSFPGYTVDRTPYGVIAHELAHHCDYGRGVNLGKYWSDYSQDFRSALLGEPPLTGYGGAGGDFEDCEWFAEMFRLFITNPDLLRAVRPATHARLISDGWKPAFTDGWEARLAGAPERTISQARKKMAQPA